MQNSAISIYAMLKHITTHIRTMYAVCNPLGHCKRKPDVIALHQSVLYVHGSVIIWFQKLGVTANLPQFASCMLVNFTMVILSYVLFFAK